MTVVTTIEVSKSVISLLKKVAKDINAALKLAGGRGRINTSQEDRYL